MAKTSEDIERLLTMLESRQLHCPECKSLDADIYLPRYEVAEVSFEMDGTIRYGDTDCANETPAIPPLLICRSCNHRWEVTEGQELAYAYDTESEGTRSKRLEWEKNVFALSDAGAVCEHCGLQVLYVTDHAATDAHHRLRGEWRHALTDNHQCATKGVGGHSRWATVDVNRLVIERLQQGAESGL